MQINKVTFVGKGGVGLLYGSMIAKALGNDAVEYIMDDARFERHANDALTVNGKHCALKSIRASEATPADLVILTVKTTGLDQAIQTMEHIVGPNTLIASLCNGITSAPELGQPIYERAVEEHDDYIAALKQCGVEVTELPALEEYPDSCFVEDPAVITRCGAIITNPGADSRNGEKDEIEPTIRQFFDDEHVKHIVAPGTLDGGDVMMVGDHFYVGRSARTNEEGIRQFIEILEGWGLEGSEVPLEEVLHLKTGVNYLEDGNMLVSGEFIEKPDFAQYNKVIVPEDEAYGANCIWVNDTVIVPEGYPTVLKAVQDLGYKTLVVDTSEYRKVDGGLSCLSLRF